MSDLERFRPEVILQSLIEHGVMFVVVGGLAAQAHGSPSLTGDLDICYARDADNLVRLAFAAADRRNAGGGSYCALVEFRR